MSPPGGGPGGAAPRLRMRGVSKRFGATVALSNVDLEVRPGEVHALLGENGAGKSTLMKLLTGVSSPTTGLVQVRGRVASLLDGQKALQKEIDRLKGEVALARASGGGGVFAFLVLFFSFLLEFVFDCT